MNVVDSSGWLEYFSDSPNAGLFTKAIEDVEHLIVPTICIYEVFKRMIALRSKDDALRAIGVMSLGQVIDLDRQIAIHAAQLSSEIKLSMADSIILATARAKNATLWTQDEHFKDLEDVRYIEKK